MARATVPLLPPIGISRVAGVVPMQLMQPVRRGGSSAARQQREPPGNRRRRPCWRARPGNRGRRPCFVLQRELWVCRKDPLAALALSRIDDCHAVPIGMVDRGVALPLPCTCSSRPGLAFIRPVTRLASRRRQRRSWWSSASWSHVPARTDSAATDEIGAAVRSYRTTTNQPSGTHQ